LNALFGKLKKIFQEVVNKVQDAILYRELSEKEIENYTNELFMKLLEADVAYEVAEKIVDDMRKRLETLKIRRGEDAQKFVEDHVQQSILTILSSASGFNLLNFVSSVLPQERPVKLLFMGINGVGKTTTIAKVAYKLKQANLKPIVIAADTFRAGAQEQLRKHAERIAVDFIGGKYGADPAATALDGILYAKKRGFDVALIDTAGRMHIDEDLMNELRKVVRVVKPHLKILVLDALTGNDALEQVKRFDEAVGVDTVILTKIDADANGGTALSVIVGVGKPIAYLGVGQQYEDLIEYDPEIVLKMLFK
jgi:fused signal recognition particle receptor